MTKTTYSTCQPGGTLRYHLDDAQEAGWAAEAEAAGANIVERTSDQVHVRWCNAHIAVWGTKECRKADIVVDDEHPQYGTLATLVYPSDRYPYVVVGGSSTGSHLIVAPVDYDALTTKGDNVRDGSGNPWPRIQRSFTREEALAHHTPERARRINRKKDGTYADHGTPFRLGTAFYDMDYSL